MQIVALFDGRNDGNFFTFRSRQLGERNHVARERAAGERAAGAEISLRPDARLTFQSGGNLLRVRAGVFAEARHLVDERDGQRQE